MQTPTLEETDEHRSVFTEFFRNKRKYLLTQMAAVRTLVAIPTASFEFPAREWQDPMVAGEENREGPDLPAAPAPAPTRDPLDPRGRASPFPLLGPLLSRSRGVPRLRPHPHIRDWARAGVREARLVCTVPPLWFRRESARTAPPSPELVAREGGGDALPADLLDLATRSARSPSRL